MLSLTGNGTCGSRSCCLRASLRQWRTTSAEIRATTIRRTTPGITMTRTRYLDTPQIKTLLWLGELQLDLKWSMQMIIGTPQWSLNYYNDHWNITMIIELLRWSLKQYNDIWNTTMIIKILQWPLKHHNDHWNTTMIIETLLGLLKHYNNYWNTSMIIALIIAAF